MTSTSASWPTASSARCSTASTWRTSARGGSESVYLADPDGNGVELTWDRDQADWPRGEDGALRLINERLDLPDLLGELEPAVAAPRR